MQNCSNFNVFENNGRDDGSFFDYIQYFTYLTHTHSLIPHSFAGCIKTDAISEFSAHHLNEKKKRREMQNYHMNEMPFPSHSI